MLHRSKEAWLLLGLVLALEIFWVGILLYVAKKGGISPGVNITFYLTDEIRRWFQYRVVTVGQLGFLVALGRYAFPTFYVLLALNYTLTPGCGRCGAWPGGAHSARNHPDPVHSPGVQGGHRGGGVAHAPDRGVLCRMDLAVSGGWNGFVDPGVFCHHGTLFPPPLPGRALLLLALAVLFALYCPQDPAQIYLFYQNDYMWLWGCGTSRRPSRPKAMQRCWGLLPRPAR